MFPEGTVTMGGTILIEQFNMQMFPGGPVTMSGTLSSAGTLTPNHSTSLVGLKLLQLHYQFMFILLQIAPAKLKYILT
jgi:hypothetical protein